MDDKLVSDKFEMGMAILLGLAAIGSAWAGFQSGLWGGNQAGAYGEAATIATQASTLQTEAFVDISTDFSIDIQAKRLINEGRDAQNVVDKNRAFNLASYLYQYQLSDAAYKALKLPPQYRTPTVEEGEAAAPAAPAAAAPAPAAPVTPAPAAEAAAEAAVEAEDEDDGDAPAAVAATPAAPASGDPDEIPPAVLIASLDVDLDDDRTYYEAMQEEGVAMQKKSQDRFAEGQRFNQIGDKYDFAGVLYTISLFFAGITSVFKSTVRNKIFIASAVVFVLTSIYVLTLPMAELPF